MPARIGVSPSALSQGLSELERRIGVPLFDREGRRRTLRPTAEPVLAHARQVIALTSDLADWAERTRTGRAGELRVGMIDAAAVGHFTDVLRQFATITLSFTSRCGSRRPANCSTKSNRATSTLRSSSGDTPDEGVTPSR